MNANLSGTGAIRIVSRLTVLIISVFAVLACGAPGLLEAQELPAVQEAVDARIPYAVAIDGDRAVVGAQWHDGYRGAAYVLRRDGGRWTVEDRLSPGDLGAWDHFGGAVAIEGDRIVVGAAWHGLQSGATYVYELVEGEWVLQQKLTASDPAPESFFGAAVNLAGTALTIRTRASARSDETFAYRFGLSGTLWREQGKETAPVADSGITMVGTRAVAGALADSAVQEEAPELVAAVEQESGESPPLGAPAALTPPASVSATDSTLEDRVRVIWENTGQDAIAYKILRDTVPLSLVSSDDSSYDDMTGTPGITYSYCVIVTDMAAEETDPVCDEGTRIIFPPYNVLASEGTFVDRVDITWVDISSINTGYNIYRDDALIGTAGPNQGWFSDTDVDTINVHSYEVAAYVTGGFESARIAHDGWRGVVLPPLEVSASDGRYHDRVAITWVDADTLEAGYRIYRDGSLIDSTGADVESFVDSTVATGQTYEYCVATIGAGGIESVHVCDEGGTALAAPGNVSASDGTFDDRIRITWDDLSDYEDGYEIVRVEFEEPEPPDPPSSYSKPDPTPHVQQLADPVVLGTARANATSYDDFTADTGIVYTYSVRAVTSDGGFSATGYDNGFKSVVLAPYDIQATAGTFEDYAEISWKSISTTTALFKILRDGVFIKTVNGLDRSYRDYGGTAGQEYVYTVIAVTAAGVEAAGLDAPGRRDLLAPSGLTASDEVYEDKTIVSWRDYSRIEQGYLVLRQDTVSAVTDTLPAIGPNRTSYTDFTAVPGVTYLYSVQAFDSINGELGYSAPGEDLGRRVLLAPTDVSVDTGDSETSAEITWRDNSQAENGYRIYRDDIEIGTTLDNATSFVDPDRVFGQNHLYRVCAYDAYGESVGDSAYAISTLAAPVSFNASDVYDDRIEMTWVNQSDIADGFMIYRDGELIRTIEQPDLTSYTESSALTATIFSAPNVTGVSVEGSRAYLACGSYGLRAIDVSDPEHPAQIGIYNTPGSANDVALYGDYAYVADGSGGLQILDISNPVPAFVGSYPAADAQDVAVAENTAGDSLYAYLAGGTSNSLLVINVTDPAAPRLSATYTAPSNVARVAVSDGYAYAGTMYSGVRILDIGDPTAPVYVNSLPVNWYVYSLAVADGYAYVGTWGVDFRIYDVRALPSAPVQVGVYPAIRSRGVAIAGDRAYVSDYNFGLHVLDISDRSNPRLISSYSEGSCYGVAADNGYVYMACYYDLHIIRLPAISPGVSNEYCVRAYKQGTVSESSCDRGMLLYSGVREAETVELYLKLTAGDGAADDFLGHSVSVSGDRAILGAYGDDDGGAEAGSAYIYELDAGGNWVQKTKLVAGDAAAGDNFGYSVSIDGDRAIVGAHGKSGAAGAAYVFARGADGSWTQKAKLIPSDPAGGDYFGYSVAISGERAVIGAYGNDDNFSMAGSAYIFMRAGDGTWSQQSKLVAGDPSLDAYFGSSVAISGDRVIIGAPRDNSRRGAAYVFEAVGSVWTEVGKLAAPVAGNEYYHYGQSVAISGDWACAGSPDYCDYVAGGKGYAVGAAYMYRRDAAGVWSEHGKLLSSDAVAQDHFGASVAISGDRLLVGARSDDDNGSASGAAYLFRLDVEGTWTQDVKVVARDGTAGDEFGSSVGIGADWAIAGSQYDDDKGSSSGSAYLTSLVTGPANVLATDGTLENRVRITWDDRSINETGYRIYRDSDVIIDLSPNTEIYEDFDAEGGRTYEYAVVPLFGELSGEGERGSDFGWHRANGNIAGSIATINGAPVDSVFIEVTPSHTKALLFDGNGGYVEIPDSTGTFDFGPDDGYTIEAWVRYPGDGGTSAGDAAMIAKAAPLGGASRYPFLLGNMRTTSPGRLRFAMSDGTTTASVSTARSDINDNKWHHVACVHDAVRDSIYIYIDGVLEGGESSAGIGDMTNDEPLTLGAGPAAGSWFNGQLDEIRIWNVARSASQIGAAMTIMLVGNETGLAAYWPIGWPSGYRAPESRGVITDLTAGAHYGIFEGGVYLTDDCAELDIHPVTDDHGNYVLKKLYYGTESEFEVRPYAVNRQFDPAVKRVVLTTNSPVENQIDFTDISTYLVTGTIKYAGTQCPVSDITLLVDGEPGGQTDTKGKFSLELERGEHWIRPEMKGHTFDPESLFVERKLNGADFEDLTVRTLAGGLGGGCGRSIGDITITVRSENDCMLETYEYGSSDTAFSVVLPPQNYFVSASVDVMSIPEGLSKTDVVRFFQNLGARLAEMDSTDVAMDFVYRAPLKVRITGFAQYLEYLEQCPGPLTFGERTLPGNLPVIPQFSEVVCSIHVYEDYGAGGLCPLDSGTVTVYDELFDALNEPLDLEVRDGLAVHPTIAIAPSLIIGRTDELGKDRSFQRSITAVANVEGRTPVAATEWVLVTGHVAPEGADFVTGATDIPLYILRDPPGDRSFASLEEGHSLRTRIEWGNNLHVLQGGINIKVWKGFSFTKKIWKLKIKKEAKIFGETDWMFGKKWSDEHYTDWTITTKKTFSTSSGDAFIGAEGDVFIGMGHNFIFSEVGVVDVDFANCEVEKSVSVGFEPDSVATVYAYTQQYIKETLIPELYSKSSYYTEQGDALLSANFRVKAEHWDSLLQENDKLKASATTLHNRSFSAGADYTYFEESSTTESYTRTTKFVLDGSLSVGLMAEKGLGAITVGGEVTLKGQWHHENLLSYEDTTGTQTEAISYTLSDDDVGDHFTVDIKNDGKYPSPVFAVLAGVSSCPYEPWPDPETGDARMMPRDKPALNIAPPELAGIPADEPAVFTLSLSNLSPTDETRLYVLRLLNTSNPYGAIVKVGDVPIANGLSYYIETTQSQLATLTVERGPTRYNYERLALVLYPPCEAGEWEQAGALADTLYFDVSFDAPCSDLAMLLPESGWVYDRADQDSSRGILMLLTDYERQISETDTIQSVWGQYRRLGVGPEGPTEWVPIPADSLGENETVIMWYPPETLEDGVYELRAYTQCASGRGYSEIATGTIERNGPMVFGTPEPADGELSFGEDISITFDKLIDCVSVHPDTLLLYPDRITLSYVDGPDSGATIAFETSCDKRTIVIAPTVIGSALEGRRLEARVAGVTDGAGNPMVSPVSWQFEYRKSRFAWSKLHLTVDVPYRDPGVVTAELVNGTEEPVAFTIAGMPAWIESVSPSGGTIPPSGTQTVIFTLPYDLAMGDYSVEVTADAGDIVAVCDLSVTVSCREPQWVVDPGAFEHSMTMVARLDIGGEISTNPDDRVAAYVGNQLRGTVALQETPMGHLAFLTIYSVRPSGETVRFQVWHADSCMLYNGTLESYPFVANGAVGSVSAPVTLTAVEMTGGDLLTIDADRGWTWISTNVRSADMSVTQILADLNLESGDLIKSQAAFSQFVEYEYPDSVPKWVPAFDLDNVSGYMVNLAQSGTIRHAGTVVTVDTTFIPVRQGWNWIGYLPTGAVDLKTALGDLEAGDLVANGDMIKSQSAFAEYLNEQWYGNLTVMEPGKGYKLRLSSDVDSSFAYPPGPYGVESPPAMLASSESASGAAALENAPSWTVDPHAYQYNMTVTAVLRIGDRESIDGADMIGAFVGGECRGVAQPVYVGGMSRYLAFMMIHSNAAAGETVTFRAFDADAGEVLEIEETLAWEADAVRGTVQQPVVLNAAEGGGETPGVPTAFSLYQNVPNPFNPATTIRFDLPAAVHVRLVIYNVKGELVSTVIDERMTAGRREVTWQGTDKRGGQVSSGVYFYRLVAGEFVETRKMIMLR